MNIRIMSVSNRRSLETKNYKIWVEKALEQFENLIFNFGVANDKCISTPTLMTSCLDAMSRSPVKRRIIKERSPLCSGDFTTRPGARSFCFESSVRWLRIS